MCFLSDANLDRIEHVLTIEVGDGIVFSPTNPYFHQNIFCVLELFETILASSADNPELMMQAISAQIT